MADAVLGLGGNIGDARDTLDRAVDLICDNIDTTLRARSSHYLTPPWGGVAQPDFVNMCLIVDTELSPRALLERVRTVERVLGRNRGNEVRWGPRRIDIDLLDYDQVTQNEAELTLPHPRLFERAFVLVPLAEIAPERVIAGTKVRDALARLDTSGIKLMPPQLSHLV
jgi:2-amino-4-hydroxy-6-hydroxymethyldihydropteridine diphosphokinase